MLSTPKLPNHLFEELAMDVYDEVDRRENDSSKYSFQLSMGKSTEHCWYFIHGCKIAGCGRHAGKLRLAGWPCRQIEPIWQMTMPADLFYFFSSSYSLISVTIIIIAIFFPPIRHLAMPDKVTLVPCANSRLR